MNKSLYRYFPHFFVPTLASSNSPLNSVSKLVWSRKDRTRSLKSKMEFFEIYKFSKGSAHENVTFFAILRKKLNLLKNAVLMLLITKEYLSLSKLGPEMNFSIYADHNLLC